MLMFIYMSQALIQSPLLIDNLKTDWVKHQENIKKGKKRFTQTTKKIILFPKHWLRAKRITYTCRHIGNIHLTY